MMLSSKWCACSAVGVGFVMGFGVIKWCDFSAVCIGFVIVFDFCPMINFFLMFRFNEMIR